MGKTVITNGVFDVLHVSHFNLLSYCRHMADKDGGRRGKVYVLIDSDEKVKTDKGIYRPYFNQEERERNLRIIDFYREYDDPYSLVDDVMIFDTDEKLYEVIKATKPDYIVKGGDWFGKKVVGEDLAKVLYFNYYPPLSSTRIIERIQNR